MGSLNVDHRAKFFEPSICPEKSELVFPTTQCALREILLTKHSPTNNTHHRAWHALESTSPYRRQAVWEANVGRKAGIVKPKEDHLKKDHRRRSSRQQADSIRNNYAGWQPRDFHQSEGSISRAVARLLPLYVWWPILLLLILFRNRYSSKTTAVRRLLRTENTTGWRNPKSSSNCALHLCCRGEGARMNRLI